MWVDPQDMLDKRWVVMWGHWEEWWVDCSGVCLVVMMVVLQEIQQVDLKSDEVHVTNLIGIRDKCEVGVRLIVKIGVRKRVQDRNWEEVV